MKKRFNTSGRVNLVAEATRPRLLLIIAVLTLVMSPSSTWAHAFLDHSTPKVGATIESSPAKISLQFTQAIEPAFSKVSVSDSAGKQVDKGDVQVDVKDATMMTVSVPSLGAGTYTVEWKVTSVDTHRTHGSFTFTVQPKR